MGTLQEELGKVIDQWSSDDNQQSLQDKHMNKAHRFPVKNNASRLTFAFIKDNPGTTRSFAEESLFASHNLKGTTVGSLITQMVSQGMIENYKGELRVLQDEYTPIKTKKVKAKTAGKQVTIVKRPRTDATEPTSVIPQAKKAWHPDDILNGLSVIQARKLYDTLLAIFTGRQV